MSASYSAKFLKFSAPAPYVLLVEFNRPPVNAFHEEFWLELGATFDKIGKDGDVRVIVLASGLQKLFTAGIDLSALTSVVGNTDIQDPVDKAFVIREHLLEFQRCISSIENCRQPVIAATHGISYGLGIDILCACDIRYAASDSVFSIKEVDVGLAADIGTLARLTKIVGNESLARELALTARPFRAEDAEKLGFISRAIHGTREHVITAAVELAKTIASKSPIAVIGTKHLMLHARDNSVADNLAYTATWNQLMTQSPDLVVAASAARSKQTPQYRPLPKL